MNSQASTLTPLISFDKSDFVETLDAIGAQDKRTVGNKRGGRQNATGYTPRSNFHKSMDEVCSRASFTVRSRQSKLCSALNLCLRLRICGGVSLP